MKLEQDITFDKNEIDEMVKNYIDYCDVFLGNVESISIEAVGTGKSIKIVAHVVSEG